MDRRESRTKKYHLIRKDAILNFIRGRIMVYNNMVRKLETDIAELKKDVEAK